MDGDKTVFVFYTFYDHMEKYHWKYGTFPDGWWYSGGGHIMYPSLYRYDEHFRGPRQSRTAMWYVLDRGFKELKERKIIKRYKISNSYIL